MSKSLRILYAVGPEDAMDAYQYWSKHQDTPAQVSVTYTSQFYELCQALDARAYVIAQSKQKKFWQDKQFIIEHRPVPLPRASGLLYHWRQIWYGLLLVLSALRFQADTVIISSGTTHWFVLSIFYWLRINVILSLHCVLWRKYNQPTLGEKVSLWLSRNFFATQCKAMLAVSHDIVEQVDQLTAGQHGQIREFFPTFRRSDLAGIAAPQRSHTSPFRVLFAGRVEADKGVFDLLEIAQRFAKEGRKDIVFDICGTGSALESLQVMAQEAGISSSFFIHGYCQKSQIVEIMSQAHVVIVPTRTDFVEGFNRVVAESILCGRPVVTSAVCPALSYVREAVMEVPPNDVQAYAQALLELYSDRSLYEAKTQACLKLQQQFYDRHKSWGASLKSILQELHETPALNHAPVISPPY